MNWLPKTEEDREQIADFAMLWTQLKFLCDLDEELPQRPAWQRQIRLVTEAAQDVQWSDEQIKALTDCAVNSKFEDGVGQILIGRVQKVFVSREISGERLVVVQLQLQPQGPSVMLMPYDDSVVPKENERILAVGGSTGELSDGLPEIRTAAMLVLP